MDINASDRTDQYRVVLWAAVLEWLSCNNCTKIAWWACDSPCWGCGWSVWSDRGWCACWCSQIPPEPWAVVKGCTGKQTCRQSSKKKQIRQVNYKTIVKMTHDYTGTSTWLTCHSSVRMADADGWDLLLSQFGPLIKPFTPWNVPHACLTGRNNTGLLTNDKLFTMFIMPMMSLPFNPIQESSTPEDNKCMFWDLWLLIQASTPKFYWKH